MVERTSVEETMTRSELAAYLTKLSAEFEGETEEIAVDVGNKSVRLEPTEELSVSIDVVERSSRLRGRRERMTIELEWKP